jgi:hypothetical protein
MTIDMTEIFGEPIYTYTRAQAIEDGVLVDVSETAREAGLKYPVAMTRAVWCDYVEIPEGVKGQDEKGRLWDILWMLRVAVGRGGSEIRYQLLVRQKGGLRRVTLKAICGPGDDASPVITIMKPEED